MNVDVELLSLSWTGPGSFASVVDKVSSRPAAVVVVSVARCDEPCFLPSGAPTFPWEAGLRN